MPKFYIGRPPQHQLTTALGWRSIVTLGQRQMAWSTGLGIVIGLVTASIWRLYYDESLPLGSPSWNEVFFTLAILVVGHEALHLVGFPYCGMNSNSIIGIWPEAGSPYVLHTLPMSRNQFLFSTLLPFLILTIFPFTLAATDFGSKDQLSWISVLNCIGAGSDIFIFIQVIFNVPLNAKVVESGEVLLWNDSHVLQ